ncbi:importin-4-like [Ischnura elegans]|uniref:importin-4-like n=1 Tax=Ischnura elegans TaxID=197161 RepID=UPI001ED87569|nr:importin-4-like [Ischnura elegans]
MAPLEEILAKLLVADNTVIQQGTGELSEAFKDPEVIPALCNVIVSSENPQIRQYAAVLLRKRFSKTKNWTKVNVEVRNGIKQGILQALVNEPKQLVKNSIAQLIGTIVKHEFPRQSWPELLQFLHQLTSSANAEEKELGMYALSVVTEISSEQFESHLSSLMVLFNNTLNSLQDLGSLLGFYTILTLNSLVPVIGTDANLQSMLSQLMPKIMEAVRAQVAADEDRGVQAMEIFETMYDSSISIVVHHIKPLIQMCLTMARDKSLGTAVRVKALNNIGWITKLKKKSVVKQNIVPSILDTLFLLMCIPPDDDDDEDYFADDNEGNTPMTCATQTLDVLALHLPPEKLIPPMLQYIEPALQGVDLYAKRASYLSLAVLAEGCAECIRTKYLELFLRCICNGITSKETVVRNAALFALGQFSEHLQPEISNFASDLLPVLFDYLDQLCTQLQTDGKEPPGVDRMFYALEMFCENLGEKLLPYLPVLMERLFTALNPANSVHLRELGLSAIGAAANAAKEDMIPYFPRIMECLKMYLLQTATPQENGGGGDSTSDEDQLKGQALDTLGVLARTVGAAHFKPLAHECINLGLSIAEKCDDPDIRKSAYGLFASVSTVAGEEMGSTLPRIVELLLASVRSCEGIVPHFKDEEGAAFPVYEDVSDTGDEEDIGSESDDEDKDDDSEIAGYSVENSYAEEKEEACLALREIAANAKSAFVPYLETSFKEVFKLINYPQEDIRKSSIEALSSFCISFYTHDTSEDKKALAEALNMFVPKLAEIVRTDMERDVVMSALDAYCEMLKEGGSSILKGEGHREAIVNSIKDVLQCKVECQDAIEDDSESDDEDAEQDELLIECAGDIIPKLGKAMSPDDFAVYFEQFYPLLIAKTKKSCTVAQKSFSIGTISESIEPLSYRVSAYALNLLPLLLNASKDKNDDVRNNAIYGLGELVLYGKETLHPHFPQILQALSAAIAKETNAMALDNICGALARLIITNVELIPMDQVFPVYLKYLPLREDFEENKKVFESFAHLYKVGHPVLLAHLGQIVNIAATVLNTKQLDKDTESIIVELLKTAQRDFPDAFSAVVVSLSPELSSKIQQLFS